MSYAPLTYCKETLEAGESFMKECKKYYEERVANEEFPIDIENNAEKIILDYGFSSAWEVNSKYSKLNRLLLQCAEPTFGANCVSYLREYSDVFCLYSVQNLWSKDKQVLRCDDDFIKALTDTDNLRIPTNICDKLPFRTFCIDFQENKVFKDYDYVYINVQCVNKILYFTLIRVVENEVFFVLNDCLTETEKDKDGIEYFKFSRKNNVRTDDGELKVNYHKSLYKNFKPRHIENDNKEDVITFMWQLMLYLIASNKDMKENPITKSTYRKPTGKPKHKFTEVQKWDMGFVWGNSFRLKKTSSEKNETQIKSTLTSSAQRKSPKPHLRNAHWSHYWCGVGRTDLQLRWLEPTFVNSTDESPAILHVVGK